jgi:hypothetical protein
MADTATWILHTPWDCRWSRFARRTTGQPERVGLWDCVHSGERLPIREADCATCPFWEYQPPLEPPADHARACERRAAKARAERLVEHGVRLSLFVLAAIFAVCGILVLTSPLAIPLTIALWMCAATTLLLSIRGNFRKLADGSFRGFLSPSRNP